MVSPEVRVLIEDARDNVSRPPSAIAFEASTLTPAQDTGGSNNGSETNETEQSLHPPTLLKNESSMSGSSARIILPLPVPSLGAGASPLAPTASRSSTSSGTFDAVPPLPNANTSGGANVQPTQRLSPDSNPVTRLPSITPDGQLIEAGGIDRSPTTLHRPPDSAASYGQDRMVAPPTSPISLVPQGGAFPGPHPGRSHADCRRRDGEATTLFPRLKTTAAATVRN
jgi:hypothetical protein